MRLVPVQARDAAALAQVHARSFEAAWSAGDIAAILAAPGGFAVAVRADADPPAVQGFLLARAIAGEAEILTLAVDPASRRRGVARALVEAAAAAALVAGAEAMFLEVAEDNAAALGLYRTAGFEQVGRRRGYYIRPDRVIDALVLRRTLNRPAA